MNHIGNVFWQISMVRLVKSVCKCEINIIEMSNKNLPSKLVKTDIKADQDKGCRVIFQFQVDWTLSASNDTPLL